jgi:hypothetical protein
LKKALKYYFICLTIFFCSTFTYGQNTSGEPGRTIDSLKLALKNAKHDTVCCNILNELVEAEGDVALWPVYNEQLQKLAEKCVLTAPTSALKKFYLKHVADAFNNMGFLATQHGDIPSVLDFYQKALKILEEIGDKKAISDFLR